MSCSPRLAPTSPVLDGALQRRNLLLRANSSSKRLLGNSVLAIVCLYDANNQCLARLLPLSPPPLLVTWLIYSAEMLIFAVAVTNVLTAIWTLVSPLHGLPDLALTSRQFQLLGLQPGSPGFTRSPEKVQTFPNPFTPLPGPLLSSPSSPPTTPLRPSLSPSSPTSPSSTNLRREGFPSSPTITDELGLDSYMASYSTWERSQVGSNLTLDESGSQTSQSMLWGGARAGPLSPSGRLDFSPQATAGRQVYCLSSPSPSPCSPGSGEKEAKTDKASTAVLSQRLGIDPLDLVGWNESLRVWLTQTVLRPLVAEVDSVNSALPKHGVADCAVGQVPVERLRKVAAIPAVAQHVPHLSAVLPYLEVCTDQTYLVLRLRQLAKTGALSQYRWNGGGEGWTERLPSDSEVLLHCLASYLDSRLLTSASMRLAGTTNPQAEAMKPFTGVSFFKHGEKPDPALDQDILAIVQVGRSPAHYVVQVGSSQLDVGAGRNNLVHTVLLFLHRVKEDRHGMLGRVNLGLSGLNLLWVLD